MSFLSGGGGNKQQEISYQLNPDVLNEFTSTNEGSKYAGKYQGSQVFSKTSPAPGYAIDTYTPNQDFIGAYDAYLQKRNKSNMDYTEYLKAKQASPGRDATILGNPANTNSLLGGL